jgi:DNA-binding response OmpR family regulator
MKLNILIADEDPVSRNVLKAALLFWGYKVLAVEDGQQACSILQAEEIDLCILGRKTAKLNGLEVCQWIRQAELRKTPQAILMTEDPRPEEISAAYLAGATDFLIKPLRLPEVRERLRVVASRIARLKVVGAQLGQLDPLECYRLDLALHRKAHN